MSDKKNRIKCKECRNEIKEGDVNYAKCCIESAKAFNKVASEYIKFSDHLGMCKVSLFILFITFIFVIFLTISGSKSSSILLYAVAIFTLGTVAFMCYCDIKRQEISRKLHVFIIEEPKNLLSAIIGLTLFASGVYAIDGLINASTSSIQLDTNHLIETNLSTDTFNSFDMQSVDSIGSDVTNISMNNGDNNFHELISNDSQVNIINNNKFINLSVNNIDYSVLDSVNFNNDNYNILNESGSVVGNIEHNEFYDRITGKNGDTISFVEHNDLYQRITSAHGSTESYVVNNDYFSVISDKHGVTQSYIDNNGNELLIRGKHGVLESIVDNNGDIYNKYGVYLGSIQRI